MIRPGRRWDLKDRVPRHSRAESQRMATREASAVVRCCQPVVSCKSQTPLPWNSPATAPASVIPTGNASWFAPLACRGGYVCPSTLYLNHRRPAVECTKNAEDFSCPDIISSTVKGRLVSSAAPLWRFSWMARRGDARQVLLSRLADVRCLRLRRVPGPDPCRRHPGSSEGAIRSPRPTF